MIYFFFLFCFWQEIQYSELENAMHVESFYPDYMLLWVIGT